MTQNKDLLTVRFTWLNPEEQSTAAMKRKGSMFVGVSPEFEMALYTACYFKLKKNGQLDISLAGKKVSIVLQRNREGQIVSCYPKMQSETLIMVDFGCFFFAFKKF